jgi:hypothetical protein
MNLAYNYINEGVKITHTPFHCRYLLKLHIVSYMSYMVHAGYNPAHLYPQTPNSKVHVKCGGRALVNTVMNLRVP